MEQARAAAAAAALPAFLSMNVQRMRVMNAWSRCSVLGAGGREGRKGTDDKTSKKRRNESEERRRGGGNKLANRVQLVRNCVINDIIGVRMC